MNGYEEAQKIDKAINELLSEHGVDKDNFHQWLRFSRTVHTTLLLLNSEIEEVSGVRPEY